MLPHRGSQGRLINFPPGMGAWIQLPSRVCDNWWASPHDGCCTGRLTNYKSREVLGGPAYCRSCAAAGLGGGPKGESTHVVACLSSTAKGTSGWKPKPKTAAARREARPTWDARGPNNSMSQSDVEAVMHSDALAPVMKEPPGIQRGHVLGRLYNFKLQLKRARDAPPKSRHHYTWKQTELALGLVYFEVDVYHWDIETRQGRGPITAGNPKRIYDTSIHKRVDWSDPFELAKPFSEDAPSYHNPPPMKNGVYPTQVIDEVKGALGGIKKDDAYCFTWFGKEATYAREMGHGACVIGG